MRGVSLVLSVWRWRSPLTALRDLGSRRAMPGPESGDGREMETNGNPNSAANWHVMRVLRVDMVMRGGGMCDHMIVHELTFF